jgi:hypothetical protein
MKNKRLLVPFFLQRFDDKLLRNKPNTWAARTHLVVYFAALFALVLTAFCYLVFFDAKQYNNTGGWVTFVGLIAFIGFIFWLIFLLRFNVFKRFGNWFAWDGLKGFTLYFINIGAMVAVCFIPSAVETFRANQQFTSEEIVKDINELNTSACKLEHNLLPLKWSADTSDIVEKIAMVAPVYNDNDDAIVDKATDTVVEVMNKANIQAQGHYKRNHTLIDTAALRAKIAETDSVVKVNDSLYIFFKCPSYVFVSAYKVNGHSKAKTLSSAEIYRSTLKNFQKPDRAALLKKMEQLKIKYAADSRYSYYDYDETYNNNDSYEIKIRKKYSLAKISNGLNNIVTKKYAWVDDWPIYLRLFYYISLVLTLLVFIFRHTTVKTFFLSVLTAVLLMIITGLLMVISNGSEASVFSFIIVYYVLFGALALSIFGSNVKKAVQGIGLNLFLFATPFIPVVFVALNKAMMYRQYNEPGYYNTSTVNNTALYFLIAEIAGSLILLILLQPLFRKLYRKWYSAPEE